MSAAPILDEPAVNKSGPPKPLGRLEPLNVSHELAGLETRRDVPVYKVEREGRDQRIRRQVDLALRRYYAWKAGQDPEPLPSGVERSNYVTAARVSRSRPGSQPPRACMEESEHRLLWLDHIITTELQGYQREILALRYQQRATVAEISRYFHRKNDDWFWPEWQILLLAVYWGEQGYRVVLV